MQTIPMLPVASQSIKVVLGAQNCQILIYQKPEGVFVDLNADGVDIVVGVIARDAVPIVCREYAGFIGNLIFIDTQGSSDPAYSGLGSRWTLTYLTGVENVLIQ